MNNVSSSSRSWLKRTGLFLLAALLILAMGIPPLGEDTSLAATEPEYDLGLYIGSPLTISKGEMKPLDSSNLNVAPIIYKDRTLVPLRAIAEHFGAEVSYEAASKAAIIKTGEGTFTFYAGKNYYEKTVAGGNPIRTTFDTEMLIRENRSMVPLRVISENILGKEVGYSKNAIVIGNTKIDLAKQTQLMETLKSKIGQAIKVSSKAQLEKILNATIVRYNQPRPVFDFGGREDMAIPESTSVPQKETNSLDSNTGAAPQESPTPAPEANSDYSSTNLQVAGIDEADIVKTDGTFIYVAGGNAVRIYRADRGNVTLTDTITLPKDSASGIAVTANDLYIDQGRLVVLAQAWQDSTNCFVYEVNAQGKSSLLKEVSLEGGLLSSRKSGNIVYLIANKYVYNWWPAVPREITPMVKDSAVSSEFKAMSLDKIMCYPESNQPQYLIIAAIDIRNTDQEANIEAILGSGSVMYMNQEHLYIAQEIYDEVQGPATAVTKYTLDGIQFGFAGGARVPGALLNQFSMDEHEGNLRLATTEWHNVSTNSIYILDKEMNLQGSLTGLAPDERIYAVRFMGDKGYVVTFRQVDPLFVLDLSDPAKPVVTGELKVPGFSNFLYPVGEDLLLGVGQSTEPAGIKFSLFDVSDQGKPKELHNYILKGSASYSEILYNHRALMFHPGKGLLAFDATLQDYYIMPMPMPINDSRIMEEPMVMTEPAPDSTNAAPTIMPPRPSEYFSGAVVLEFTKSGGFREKGRIPYDYNAGYYGGNTVRRLCYIGNYLYYVQDNAVRGFDLDTLKPVL